MKDNRGFSFVELVVTVALIAAFAAISTMGVVSLSGMRASSCAKKIITYMDETKTNSLGFDEVELKLYQKSDESYWIQISQYTSVYDSTTGSLTVDRANPVSSADYLVGDKTLDIQIKAVSDSEVVYSPDLNDIYISFDRASGAFKPMVVTNKGLSSVVSDTYYIDTISVSQEARTPNVIKCVRLTGKFFLQ